MRTESQHEFRRWLRYLWSTEEYDRRGAHTMRGGVAMPASVRVGDCARFAKIVRRREWGGEPLRNTPEHREALDLSHDGVEALLDQFGCKP